MRCLFLVRGAGAVQVRSGVDHARHAMPHQPARNVAALLPKLATRNSGNLIHWEAMARTVACSPDGSTFGAMSFGGRGTTRFETALAYLDQNYDAILMSFANTIQAPAARFGEERLKKADEANFTRAEMVRRCKCAVYAFGMGIQDDLPPGGASAIAPGLLDLLRALNEKAAILAVRGAKTESWLHSIGVDRAVALGCPSLFVNPWATLEVRAPRYWRPKLLSCASHLSERGMGEGRLQPMVRMAAGFDTDFVLQNDILAFTADRRNMPLNSLTGELDRTLAARKETSLTGRRRPAFNRYYYFSNADTWRGYAATRDLYVGDRLHGGVAFLQVGRPAAFVKKDARIGELTEYFGLPSFTRDEIADMRPRDLPGRIADALPHFRERYGAALRKFITVCRDGGLTLNYSESDLPI